MSSVECPLVVHTDDTATDHGRFKSVCCVPYFVIAVLIVSCLVVVLVLMAVYGFRPFGTTSASPPADYNVINSVLITLSAVVGIVILANIYTWMRAIVYLALPTRKQACFAPHYHYHWLRFYLSVTICSLF